VYFEAVEVKLFFMFYFLYTQCSGGTVFLQKSGSDWEHSRGENKAPGDYTTQWGAASRQLDEEALQRETCA